VAEDFVFEIGTEELPAGDLSDAVEAIPRELDRLLDEVNLSHGAIEALGTPRRLVAFVRELSPTARVVEQRVKGPPFEKAFDESGRPTKEAIGWARKYNVHEDELSNHWTVEGNRKYLALVRAVPGGSANSLLSRAVLPELLRQLRFDQTMRWVGTPGDSPESVSRRRTAFSRPIRWLLALHGGHVVPFEYAGLNAGRTTRSRRFEDPDVLTIGRAGEYGPRLAEQGILLDPAERRQSILEQGRALAASVSGILDEDPDLVEEVANMVEAPQAQIGSFDSAFLSLPAEVLVAVMKKHQRYFPVRDGGGKLLPHFVAVRNGGASGADTIRAGNEHVLRARFADAAFFLKHDLQHPLEFYRPSLGRVTFHARLGTMLDKADRLRNLIPFIGNALRLSDEAQSVAHSAAFLCKADLATSMVTEMTSLQGVLGEILAREHNEPPQVARAIYEHYLPRFSGDSLPESGPGRAVGLADRLDTLAGLFAAQIKPTGTRDPFGLRRTAVGFVEILVSAGIDVDLYDWLEEAKRHLPVEFSDTSKLDCLLFITARQGALLLAEGYRYDVVQAVLELKRGQGKNPAGAAKGAKELQAAAQAPEWLSVLQAYARCERIVRSQKVDGRVQAKLLEMEAELVLWAAVQKLDRPASVNELVTDLKSLVSPISEFFDKVLVMDEDKAKRTNRLALVQRVVALADGIADLSKLEGF
jgi:glycyl-tRNA synthetase